MTAPLDPSPVAEECPRCRRAEMVVRFYGPCDSCRDELIAKFAAEGSTGPAAHQAYEPKMNVTPNFVATKD
jgi:hypothetical protein